MTYVYGDTFELQERLEYHIINIKKGYSGKCQAVCDIEAAILAKNTDLRYEPFQPDYEVNADGSPAIVDGLPRLREGRLYTVGGYNVSLAKYQKHFADANMRLLKPNRYGDGTNAGLEHDIWQNIENPTRMKRSRNNGIANVTAYGIFFLNEPGTGALGGNLSPIVRRTVPRNMFNVTIYGRLYLTPIDGQLFPYAISAAPRGVDDVLNIIGFGARGLPRNAENIAVNLVEKILSDNKFRAPFIAHNGVKYYQAKLNIGAEHIEYFCVDSVYKAEHSIYDENLIRKHFTLAHMKLLLKTYYTRLHMSSAIKTIIDGQKLTLLDYAAFVNAAPDNMSVGKIMYYLLDIVNPELTFDKFFPFTNIKLRLHTRVAASFFSSFRRAKKIDTFVIKATVETKINKYNRNTHEFNFNTYATANEQLRKKISRTFTGCNYASFNSFVTTNYIMNNMLGMLPNMQLLYGVYENRRYIKTIDMQIGFANERARTPLDEEYCTLALFKTYRSYDLINWYTLFMSHTNYGPYTTFARGFSFENYTIDLTQSITEVTNSLINFIRPPKANAFIEDNDAYLQKFGKTLAKLSLLEYDVKSDKAKTNDRKNNLIKFSLPSKNREHYYRIVFNGVIFYIISWFLIKHSKQTIPAPPKKMKTFVN